MRTSVDLFATADFAVSAVTCSDHHEGWSEPEVSDAHRIVLVRGGAFRRRAADGVADLGPTVGYVSVPGAEEQFAHPAGGDVCTAVWVAPAVWGSVLAERRPARSALYVDAALELAHRQLSAGAAEAPADVAFGVAEALVRLVAATADGPLPGVEDRAVVARARAAVEAGLPEAAGLVSLARLLGVSPYRLSRAFSREVGVSLTRSRNRVRVGWVLARIEGGERDLAGLAAEYGFADQAHLTRTVRQHVGHTPGAVRRLLRPEPAR